MKEAFWNIKRNHHKYKDLCREHDGEHCYECNRPMRNFNIRCPTCARKLATHGMEEETITFRELGEVTRNYQYYLFYAIYGYAIGSKHRGKREDRIKANITKDSINKAMNKIDELIKSYDNDHKRMYMLLLERNRPIKEKLIFNLILHFLAYHNTDIFKSEAHFMATTMRNFTTSINRIYWMETKEKARIKVTSYGVKYKYRIYEQLEDMMSKLKLVYQ